MSQAKPFCPYVGLQPYTEADRDYFFGREEDAETIAANLVTAPLTTLYGASGVGKTSVLLAGVIPFLHTLPDVTVVVFRDWQDPTFLSSLKADLTRAVAERTGEPFSLDDAPLDELLAEATRAARGTLTVILDQFEEYFLYNPEAAGNPFDIEFARTVNREEIDANFLLSLREDSLSRLDRFQGRIPSLFDNYLRLEHLNREAARAAIERPVAQYNRLHAAAGDTVSVEPALVGAVLEQVQTGQVVLSEAGRGRARRGGVGLTPTEAQIETPYLQLVMTRLWEAEMRTGSRVLQRETLEGMGGAEQIVRGHLDETMRELMPEEQDAAATVFYHLVTPSGAKVAHTAPDLAEFAELPQEKLAPLLDRLSSPEVRVLRPVAAPDQPAERRYEIFHDVLAPAVLDWRARRVQAQERAEAEAKLVQEQQRVRRLRLGFVGLSLLFVVMVVLGIVAIRALATARDAEAEKAVLLDQLVATGSRVIDFDGVEMEFVYVPAGPFEMGSESGNRDEQPVHTVTLDGFLISKTEVTNAQYAPFVEAGGYLQRDLWTADGWEWREAEGRTQPACWDDEQLNQPDYPVVCVSWYEAVAYTRWLAGETGEDVRLPTEAEWEKAARGTDGRTYPWGNSDPDGSKLNFCDVNCAFDWKDESVDDGYARTAPVGSYAAGQSPYGVYDMAGNIWEWTSSLYEGYPYDPEDGREDLEAGSRRRVVRGGAWSDPQNRVRAASRNYSGPGVTSIDVGVRCAASLGSP